VKQRGACRIEFVIISSIRNQDGRPMLQIRNERVVQLAAKLAAIRRSTKTEAVLRALENDLARIESEKTLEERVRPIQDRIASRPATGLEADKAFFDELSGES
jgi:antitoxin VapB